MGRWTHKPKTIDAGQLVMISIGEYSDYTVHGLYRAREAFTVDEYDSGRSKGQMKTMPEYMHLLDRIDVVELWYQSTPLIFIEERNDGK